jgi:hypothetical protein
MCREIHHILVDRWLRSLKKIWRWKLFSELPVIVMYLQISHTYTFLVNIWHTAQSQIFLNLIQLSLTLLFKSEVRNLWVTTQILLYIFFKKLNCPPKTAYLIICPEDWWIEMCWSEDWCSHVHWDSKQRDIATQLSETNGQGVRSVSTNSGKRRSEGLVAYCTTYCVKRELQHFLSQKLSFEVGCNQIMTSNAVFQFMTAV